MALQASTHPFDAAAAAYDASFTDRRLGRWLRGIVRQRLLEAFEPGQQVLELGCGTGEDAVWLAGHGLRITATDASPAMLDVTRHKADEAGAGEAVTTRLLDLQDAFAAALPAGGYDGAFSNFGPLNCVADRRALSKALAGLIRPGGNVVLVVMGPVCPWEIAWHLLHLRPRDAVRRFRSGRAAHVGGGETLPVWYPSPLRLRREFAPYFRTLEVAGVGLLLPPTEMGRLVDRAPGFFGRLATLDRRFAGALPWRWLNDHYLLVLERR